MPTGFEHLEQEHQTLRTAIEQLRTTAERAGTASADELVALVATDHRFLLEGLLPHAAGEEEVLYPALQEVLKSDKVTLGMEHDHHHIELLVLELGPVEAALAAIPSDRRDQPVNADLAHDLRRVFYSLYAVIMNHFEKEEGIYVPRLASAMSPDEARQLSERLEAAVARRRAAAGPGLPPQPASA